MNYNNSDNNSTSKIKLPWQEKPKREANEYYFILLAIWLLGLAIYAAISGGYAGTFGALLLLAFLYLVWFGPHVASARVATVDHDGLILRNLGYRLWPTKKKFRLVSTKRIPADQIGEVKVIRGNAAMSLRSSFMTYKGKKLGWGKVNLPLGEKEGILIEQKDPKLKRPWWMLATSNVDELHDALVLARDSAINKNRQA